MRSVEDLILANTVNRENSQNSQDRIVWHLEIESVEGQRSVWDVSGMAPGLVAGEYLHIHWEHRNWSR